jgi:hypothetical protein
MEQLFLIRRARVSSCLAEVIQWIQSRGAPGVMSDHSFRPTLSQWLFWPPGFERGLKRKAIDRARDRRHTPRGELGTNVLRQDEKGPGTVLFALGRPEEFRSETDRGLVTWLVSLIGMRALDCAVRSQILSEFARAML